MLLLLIHTSLDQLWKRPQHRSLSLLARLVRSHLPAMLSRLPQDFSPLPSVDESSLVLGPGGKASIVAGQDVDEQQSAVMGHEGSSQSPPTDPTVVSQLPQPAASDNSSLNTQSQTFSLDSTQSTVSATESGSVTVSDTATTSQAQVDLISLSIVRTTLNIKCLAIHDGSLSPPR